MSLLSADSGLKTLLASCPHAKSLTMASRIAGEHPSRHAGLSMVKSASWIEQDSACLQRQSAGRLEVSVRQPRAQVMGGTQSRIGLVSIFRGWEAWEGGDFVHEWEWHKCKVINTCRLSPDSEFACQATPEKCNGIYEMVVQSPDRLL